MGALRLVAWAGTSIDAMRSEEIRHNTPQRTARPRQCRSGRQGTSFGYWLFLFAAWMSILGGFAGSLRETLAGESANSPAFTQAVADARNAMARRDLAAAKKLLDQADQAAKGAEDSAQVERLRTILGYLDQFWNGIRSAMAKLNANEEIVVRDVHAIVVENDRDTLVVKTASRIHRYTIETLPTPLVMMFVEQSFGKDVDSHAVIAAFLAVDPKGDRTLAKHYWQEAAKADIDTEKLLPELDAFPRSPATIAKASADKSETSKSTPKKTTAAKSSAALSEKPSKQSGK
jgi:hypothetical protein